MGVTMNQKIDIGHAPRWDMYEVKCRSAAITGPDERPIHASVVISAYDHERNGQPLERIQRLWPHDIPEVPDFVRRGQILEHAGRKPVVSISDDSDPVEHGGMNRGIVAEIDCARRVIFAQSSPTQRNKEPWAYLHTRTF